MRRGGRWGRWDEVLLVATLLVALHVLSNAVL